GPDIAGMREQPDVVFVIGLEDETHGLTSNLFSRVKAEQAFGLEQQHREQDDIGRDVLPALRQVEAGHALDHADQHAADQRARKGPEAARTGGGKRLQSKPEAEFEVDEVIGASSTPAVPATAALIAQTIETTRLTGMPM